MSGSASTQYVQQDEFGNPIPLDRYQPLPGGKGVVVPRRTAGGGSPAIDRAKGLSQFKIIDVIENEDGSSQQIVHQPGSTDPHGNIPNKEAACPPSPPTAPTPAPMSPEPGSPAPKRGRPRQPRGSTSPPTPTVEPDQPTKLHSELSELRSQILELSSRLVQPPSPQQPTSSPTSVVRFDGPFGSIRCEAVDIRAQDGLLVLVYRADAPVQFTPTAGQEVQVSWGQQSVRARTYGLNVLIQLDQQYIVTLFTLAE